MRGPDVAAYLVVAAVLFGLALAALSHIINSGIEPVRNRGTVSVPADGFTLYTTDPVSTATCTLGGGGEPVGHQSLALSTSSVGRRADRS